MRSLTAPQVVSVAEILGKGDLDAVAKAVAVEQLLQSKELATRAIDCIPEAFGAVLVGHMGNTGLPAPPASE